MRLKEEHIQRIARLVLRQLKTKNLITPRVSEEKIEAKIVAVITKDLRAEVEIEAEARKVLAGYRTQIASGEIDEHKMFLMIKKELAKKKGMVL